MRTLVLAALVGFALTAVTHRAAGQEVVVIKTDGNAFISSYVELVVGSLVIWKQGGGTHTVTEGFGPEPTGEEAFDSPLDYQTTQFSLRFDQRFLCNHPRVNNIYNYYCQPHWPGMTGVILVYSPWESLFNALPGGFGEPSLCGFGSLQAGTTARVALSNGPPGASGALYLAFASNPTPFMGGVLLPFPPASTFLFELDNEGGVRWSAVVDAGLSGVQVGLQAAIQDAAAVKGVSLSNALVATFP